MDTATGVAVSLGWSKPLHLEVQAILIRSFEDNPVGIPFQIAFADDYVSVGILLSSVHGVLLLSVPSLATVRAHPEDALRLLSTNPEDQRCQHCAEASQFKNIFKQMDQGA